MVSPKRFVVRRNCFLPSRKRLIPARHRLIATRNQLIPARNRLIATRNELIPARNRLVAARNRLIVPRNRLIVSRNQTFPARNQTIPARKKGPFCLEKPVLGRKSPFWPLKGPFSLTLILTPQPSSRPAALPPWDDPGLGTRDGLGTGDRLMIRFTGDLHYGFRAAM